MGWDGKDRGHKLFCHLSGVGVVEKYLMRLGGGGGAVVNILLTQMKIYPPPPTAMDYQ